MGFITEKTITATFLERIKQSGDATAFRFKPTYPEMGTVGAWKSVTFKEFHDEVRLLSLGLMELGIKPGDKVAILSNTRFEWSACDMAILGAGAVTVPVYASNTTEDVVHILNHSEARIVLAEDAKQIQKIFEARAANAQALPKVEKLVTFEPSAVTKAAQMGPGAKDVLTYQALKELGRRREPKDADAFQRNCLAAKPDDLITLCYTSGTTGVPKGAMLSHDNMMSVLEDCVASLTRFIEPEKEEMLSFLPYSHVLGKVESMAIYTFGWQSAFAENIDKLMVNIGEIRPTILFAVPRIFEKAYNRINATVDGGSPLKRKLFKWGFKVGKEYYSAIWEGKMPSARAFAEYQVAKTLVFGKVSQRFGGRLRFAVCGGAPLPREIGEFFQIVGIKVLEGYGLTETCAPVAVNLPDDARFGVVGRPLPEVTIKIAEDGEILVKSRKVFKGYYKMPAETAEVMDGPWLKTGDIGLINSDGFLKITDRKKDLIITSGGKNVAPQKIENMAKSQKYINQFVVHGDQRNYLTALVTLDKDSVLKYASEHQILFSEWTELIKNPKILALVQKVLDEVNKSLASFETIKKFLILPNEFTIESGEMTPSLKIKRGVVNKRYKAELDSMYH